MQIAESYTCISCRVQFKEPELQRLHYKSDWHRYNLKRKIADLPPIDAEEFQRRVLNQKNANSLLEQSTSVYCDVCRKAFGNRPAYDNHLKSKKHRENDKKHVPSEDGKDTKNQPGTTTSKSDVCQSKEEEDDQMDDLIEEVDSDEWADDTDNPIDQNNCMFCLHHSRSFVKNLEHMTLAHSFFVPDIEYCVDLEGLLRYLGEKISAGFMCLWCNDKGKTFYSADSVRSHMLSKGHCKMLHEGLTLAEYADYYDYSESYPDHNEDSVDKDAEVDLDEIEVNADNEYQLVLPSGVTVGHRSLMRYYKQSIDPNRSLVVASNKGNKLHKVLAQYRALGWTETQQAAAAKKARDLHYMKRLQSKYSMKMGVKANKFQTHFRQQVNF